MVGEINEQTGPPAPPPAVIVTSYNERPDVARAAVEHISLAFEDDPSTMYFCRRDKRVDFYRSVLSCLLEWYPRERQIVSTLPPDAAAFVYLYPRLRPLGAWAKLLRGGLAPLLSVRLDRMAAGAEAGEFFEEKREAFLREHGPFLYVSVMGVRPSRQGRGLGSALLAFLCDRADAAGLPMYIEATSPRNQLLYERFGFRLLEAWRGNPEMPFTCLMARLPQPLAAEAEPSVCQDAEPGVRAGAEAPAADAGHSAAVAAMGAEGTAPAGSSGHGDDSQQPQSSPQPLRPPGIWGLTPQQRRGRFTDARRQQQERTAVARYDDAGADEYWPWWPEGPHESRSIVAAATAGVPQASAGPNAGPPDQPLAAGGDLSVVGESSSADSAVYLAAAAAVRAAGAPTSAAPGPRSGRGGAMAAFAGGEGAEAEAEAGPGALGGALVREAAPDAAATAGRAASGSGGGGDAADGGAGRSSGSSEGRGSSGGRASPSAIGNSIANKDGSSLDPEAEEGGTYRSGWFPGSGRWGPTHDSARDDDGDRGGGSGGGSGWGGGGSGWSWLNGGGGGGDGDGGGDGGDAD
ncbi:hypothetical protein GPECTOR_44g90 [Gonium pectorale]|uniref:N-acetyltransferase domain-containing protein n=1 Tax=Gonium pectorale TaxID=33097 RepID=A0A150G993_GONPE|nr:hypothetical protein GPECTOR_44g90 [Gonium pectorale]|eukprot:KXZ46417.1 hypothetical protein GPECTOR_44g90 [Gonium pectorale]